MVKSFQLIKDIALSWFEVSKGHVNLKEDQNLWTVKVCNLTQCELFSWLYWFHISVHAKPENATKDPQEENLIGMIDHTFLDVFLVFLKQKSKRVVLNRCMRTSCDFFHSILLTAMGRQNSKKLHGRVAAVKKWVVPSLFLCDPSSHFYLLVISKGSRKK